MTTKNFSAIKLPHSSDYSLDIGHFKLHDQHLNLPTKYLPRFSHLAHVIEVVRLPETKQNRSSTSSYSSSSAALKAQQRLKTNVDEFLRYGSYLVIENARPELFLRRDFIARFVSNGTFHLSHVVKVGQTNAGYQITCRNNVLLITMTSRQYHRFGMVAKRVKKNTGSGANSKSYLVEIDLKERRIVQDNKYQDRLVATLKRLPPIRYLYFRFIPTKTDQQQLESVDEHRLRRINRQDVANEDALRFFQSIIDEYALDGCQPVPLTNCKKFTQKVKKIWTNSGQLHPELDLSALTGENSLIENLGENNADKLSDVINIVDWLGFQVLKLDCDKDEIKSQYSTTGGGRVGYGGGYGANDDDHDDRLDVSCTEIVGTVDFRHVQDNLWVLFGTKELDNIVLRALILHEGIQGVADQQEPWGGECLNYRGNGITKTDYAYRGGCVGSNGAVFLQDCSRGSEDAAEMIVMRMMC